MTTPTSAEEWSIVAHHEAGHVIGYLHFGYRCGVVRVWEHEDGKIYGSVNSPAGRYACRARAVIYLGGPIAEEFLTGRPYNLQPDSVADLLGAEDALARSGEPADIASIVPATRQLIEREQAGQRQTAGS
jgi:hypothetical protein